MKKTAVQELRELLFSPVDPLPLALFRVVFGLVLLGSFLTLCPDFDPLFTENSPVRLEDSRLLSEYAWIEPVPSWRWNLFELSPSSTWAAALFILYGFSVLAMTLGWRTRLATLLVFLLTVSIHRREPIIWTGGDFLFQIFAFWLLFVPAGAALSVDAWRRRQEGTPQPLVRSWALLLLQAQLALVYFSTFLLKLQTVSWKSGTALFHAWQLPHYARPWGASLAAVPGLALVSTYGALFFELAFPLLIWNRRFRPWLLLLGASLHLSIELTFRAGPFSSVMLAAYIPFLAPVTLRRWLGRFFPGVPPNDSLPWHMGLLRQGKWVVYFDGNCGFCRRWIKRAQKVTLKQVQWRDFRSQGEEAAHLNPRFDQAAYLIINKRIALPGFLGFRRLLFAMPLFWVLLPLAYLPGSRRLGDAVYRFISVRYGPVKPVQS